MFDVILDSGEQMSVFKNISVHFQTIFYTHLKKLARTGGDTKIKKITPLYQNYFFFRLKYDTLIICNLQLIKNNGNT